MAVVWQRIYCVFIAASFGCVGTVFFEIARRHAEEDLDDSLLAALFGAGILFLAFLHLVGLVLPARPWVWSYHLMLQLLGLIIGGPLLMVFCIPLCIHWWKPATKAYFGRSVRLQP